MGAGLLGDSWPFAPLLADFDVSQDTRGDIYGHARGLSWRLCMGCLVASYGFCPRCAHAERAMLLALSANVAPTFLHVRVLWDNG